MPMPYRSIFMLGGLAVSMLAALAACGDAPTPAGASAQTADETQSAAMETGKPEPAAAASMQVASAIPAVPARAGFAAAPASGTILRSSCRSGACDWLRLETVKRSDDATGPSYRFIATAGESRHGDTPYPLASDGVAIEWQAAALQGQVRCSHRAPYVEIGAHADMPRLNPQGVAGAVQGLANLYFALCHGEYSDDAELARKYGYDLR